MPWCATETTKNGTVTPSRWGDCKIGSLSTCEVESLEVPTCTTATPLPGASVRIVNQPSEALGLSGLPCVFPFRYKVSQSSVDVSTYLSLHSKQLINNSLGLQDITHTL